MFIQFYHENIGVPRGYPGHGVGVAGLVLQQVEIDSFGARGIDRAKTEFWNGREWQPLGTLGNRFRSSKPYSEYPISGGPWVVFIDANGTSHFNAKTDGSVLRFDE